MAERIVFVPKRKMEGAFGDPGIADAINHVAQSLSAPGTTPSGTTVAVWNVTDQLGIPFGTDKYGRGVQAGRESQELNNFTGTYVSGATRSGFRKTIKNQQIQTLSFYLKRVGTPLGDVTYTIRRVSDDSIIQSEVLGTAANRQTSLTWEQVIFSAPVLINEDVRILCEAESGTPTDRIDVAAQNSDVRANEFRTIYVNAVYTDQDSGPSNRDATYRYDWSTAPAGALWMEDSNLHGFDENAIERKYIHTDDVDDVSVNGEIEFPISSNWAFDHENDDDVHDATAINVEELGTATYDDVQDYINFFGDRTLLSGGAITDNGDGTAAIASLTGWCKETDSATAIGKFFDFAGGNTATLVDLTTNYVFLDYNGGTPQLAVTITFLSLAFKLDHIEIGTIYREGTTLHFHQHHNIGIDRANTQDIHNQEEAPAHRASGLVTTDAGSLALSVSAGVIYEGVDREPTVPFDTPNSGTADDTEVNTLHDADGGFAATDVGKTVHNTTDDTYANVTVFVDSGQLTLDADIFISGETYDLDIWTACFTSDSGSTWTLVKGQTLIDNANYNDITSGLTNLTVNRYAVHWVFIDLDGKHLNTVYGQGNYTASQAIDAAVPALLPDLVRNYSALIAKIIVKQGQTTLTIAFPWTTSFSSTLSTDHGNLAGLSDDDHPQYIKDTEFTQNSGVLVGTGAGTFQEETGATLLTSVGAMAIADVKLTALAFALSS